MVMSLRVLWALSWLCITHGLRLRRSFPAAVLTAGSVLASLGAPLQAANLPVSNGASGSKVGSAEALKPIVEFKRTLEKADKEHDLSALSSLLRTLPESEASFKRVFDEYSNGISYKQMYLDKNAFVVYYTKGFDGPGRDSIEKSSPEEELQAQQYYYRNEAWIGVDEARAEVEYLKSSPPSEPRQELEADLKRALQAVSSYVELADQGK